MKALEDFRPIQPGADFHIGATRISTYALCHPGGCLAYRLENAGHVYVFATDHEHVEVPDRGLAAFARGADVLYTEGQYTLAEYEGRDSVGGNPPLVRVGWGHSTIEACVATAVAAEVRELHLGHRDPRAATTIWPGWRSSSNNYSVRNCAAPGAARIVAGRGSCMRDWCHSVEVGTIGKEVCPAPHNSQEILKSTARVVR